MAQHDEARGRAPRPASQAVRTGHAVIDLVEQARGCLARAELASTAAERYATAHLAALRAGAAVLAARARPEARIRRGGRTRGPRNVWVVLAEVAPELSEWAGFFAAGAGKRAAAEAALPRAVTVREADDLVRDADTFISLVCALLELPNQPSITPALAAG